MHWNNRIMRHKHPNGDYYQIHEVYYDGDKKSWTVEPIVPFGETVDELIEHLEMMLRDAKKCKEDILDYDENEEPKDLPDLSPIFKKKCLNESGITVVSRKSHQI